MEDRLYEILDGVYIVEGSPILYVKDHEMIVFSDLHLGFEEEMARQGIFIPRAQLRRAIRAIDDALQTLDHAGYRVSRALINGDLKHAFDRLSRQERIEVKELLNHLMSKVREVILIRGNHDNYLPLILKEYGLELRMYYTLTINGRRIMFTHGHVIVDVDADIIIIGHEHPCIGLVDQLGLIAKVPCYLKVPLSNGQTLVVMPALGAYQAGTRVSLDRRSYLSPYIIEKSIIEDAIPYAIMEGSVLELPRLNLLFKIAGLEI